MFFVNAMIWFIVGFGIGYFIVSRDVSKNHGIVVVGAFAKIVFFTDCVVTVALAQASAALIAFGSVDLLFAVLFIEFLLWIKKSSVS